MALARYDQRQQPQRNSRAVANSMGPRNDPFSNAAPRQVAVAPRQSSMGGPFAEMDAMMAQHRQMANQMFERANKMMGGGFGDPFKDDPFFSGAGFGNIDKMMADMHKRMAEPIESQLGKGQGRFQSMKTVSSTKMDPSGRPVKETY